MTPDLRLREKLQELASAQAMELDAATRARVRDSVLAQAEKPARPARMTLGLVFVLASLVAIWFGFRGTVALVEPPLRKSAAAAPATSKLPPAGREPAPCGEIVAGQWLPLGTGGSELDLGPRARFVAEARTRVRTLGLESCSTRVRLEQGALYVHARDLKAGALVVESALGNVTVRGTRFGVRVTEHELRVTVDEGKVLVTPRTGAEILLQAGQHLNVREGRKRKLVKVSKDIRAEVVPAEMELEMEIEMEKVWQQGTLQPPDEPFDPGSSMTEDARPMRKPRVVEGEVTP